MEKGALKRRLMSGAERLIHDGGVYVLHGMIRALGKRQRWFSATTGTAVASSFSPSSTRGFSDWNGSRRLNGSDTRVVSII